MSRGRILVVEDNVLNRQLMRDILQHAGYSIAEAGSVDEGRARLEEDTPDVVLLDVQLPGGGGERLLAQIREEDRWSLLPVIAVTAFAMQGDRERLLAGGFDAYMSKPIDTRRFADEVSSVLLQHRASAKPLDS